MKIRLRRGLMGNHKFRFSDMMPNAWFYKLRDMSRTSSKHTNTSSHSATKKKQSSNCQKQSYLYFSNTPKRQNRFSNSPVHSTSKNSLFQESSPRKSFYKKRVKRQTIYKPSSKNVSSSSVTDGCSCHSRINSVRAHDKRSNLCTQDSSNYLLSALESSPESFSSDDQIPFCSQSSDCKISTSTNDIIIHMNNNAFTKKKFNEIGRFDTTVSQIELPPIQTKTEKLGYSSSEIKEIKKRSVSYEVSKTHKKNPRTANSPGIKLRVNSPKIQVSARKSISKSQRKGISDSFAVVKSSVDPRRDFRESMVEMIAENNIRASRDMEDLLACYLSLNSDEYHDLIIEAFKQIWFDMKNLNL